MTTDWVDGVVVADAMGIARLIANAADEKYSVGHLSIDRWNGTVTVHRYCTDRWWERVGTAPADDVTAIARLLVEAETAG